MADDPKVERLAEATSPDGKLAALVAVWNDGTVSSCTKVEGKKETECYTVPTHVFTPDSINSIFGLVLHVHKQAGWKVRILHDPSALDFLPEMDSE